MVAEREIPAKQCTRTHPLEAFAFSMSQIQKGSLMTTLFSSEILFPFTHTMACIWQLEVKPIYLPIFQYFFKEVGEDDFPTIYI